MSITSHMKNTGNHWREMNQSGSLVKPTPPLHSLKLISHVINFLMHLEMSWTMLSFHSCFGQMSLNLQTLMTLSLANLLIFQQAI